MHPLHPVVVLFTMLINMLSFEHVSEDAFILYMHWDC